MTAPHATPTLIIAEAGVNHNGDLDMAHRLVDAAKDAGADIVKFQIFRTEDGISPLAPKASYQAENTGKDETQRNMVKKLELPMASFVELKKHCDEVGIRFFATPFDRRSTMFLREMGESLWKIPSGEITNLPHLRYIGSFGQTIILSTGMSTLGDIETALDILERAGTARNDITLLHCTTDYPTSFEDANLRAMETLRGAFPGVAGVGFSDHTEGIAVSVAAVALGATIIEKHFTLDKELKGPDHKASVDPRQLAELIISIRQFETALGDGIKKPTRIELDNRIVARKSLIAARPIVKGEIFSEDNLTVKRPGSGVSPLLWDDYVGKPAPKDYTMDELL